MDNDFWGIKILKRYYKKAKFKIDYWNYNIISEKDGNEEIKKIILSEKPTAVVRLGSTETRCIYPWLCGQSPTNEVMQRGKYSGGIFPPDSENNAVFSRIYTEALSKADYIQLVGVYKEKYIINKFCKNGNFLCGYPTEPYYFDNPWSECLKDKRVLIIHPFVASIEKQYTKREVIWGDRRILPEFKSLEIMQSVQSHAGNICNYVCWKDALYSMYEEIEKRDFDIAIIGAGAYSLPLTIYVKEKGKIGIQMSGATQILFGIKGRRWDNHPVISEFYNEHWVRPERCETPLEIERVEGGSYW